MQFQKSIFNTLKKLKILVIDSSPIIYIGLKSIFKNSLVFEVSDYLETAEDVYEILDNVEIDLIISDLNYRKGSVSNLLKKFKKNKTEIPVIIFTSESVSYTHLTLPTTR